MADPKKYCDELIKGLGNILTEEQKEKFRKQAEKVARESLEGFQQLKEELKDAAATMKQGADDTLQQLESAFIEFQTNIEGMEERRHQQVDDLHNKLVILLERLRQAEISEQVKDELRGKTENVLKMLKECAEGLSLETTDLTKKLMAMYAQASENKNQEIKAAIEDISQSISNPNKTQAKK